MNNTFDNELQQVKAEIARADQTLIKAKQMQLLAQQQVGILNIALENIKRTCLYSNFEPCIFGHQCLLQGHDAACSQGQKNHFLMTSPTLEILLASPFLEEICISAVLNLEDPLAQHKNLLAPG
jgi:hypothetical protein